MGIWCVSQWEQFNKPNKMQLVELGPGRGTLMKDLLRAARHFPEFYNGLEIHLVEMSSGMRAKQKPLPDDSTAPKDIISGQEHMILRDSSNINVFWHNTIASVPRKNPSLIIGHEFLDALPIQKFQYTKKGWREILIDLKEHLDWEVDESIQNKLKGTDHASAATVAPIITEQTGKESGIPEFKEILCPHNNLAATAMLGGLYQGEQVEQNEEGNESAFVNHLKQRKKLLEDEIQKSKTFSGSPKSKVIIQDGKDRLSTPTIPLVNAAGISLSKGVDIGITAVSENIDVALSKKHTGPNQNSTISSIPNLYGAKEGDTIEVCPDACMMMQDIIMWLEETKGSALFIDYGNNYAASNSIRGIKNHKFVPYLQEPGNIDITADVDFLSLRKVVENSKSDLVKYYGPIPQGYFLCGLGIEERVRQMAETVEDDSKVDDIIQSAERLVHKDEMGEIYKVCCLTTGPEPTGFEGQEQFI